MEFELLEKQLHILAPQLEPARRAVEDAERAYASAQQAAAQARQEYNYYAGMNSAALDDETRAKQAVVVANLSAGVAAAEDRTRSAGDALRSARSQLSYVESSLRSLANSYGQLKAKMGQELEKLTVVLKKTEALSGNRYASVLSSAYAQAQAAYADRSQKIGFCDTRIGQIRSALNEGGDEPPQKKLVKKI